MAATCTLMYSVGDFMTQAAQQEAGELADKSAEPGRRLQTDIINQSFATGRPNKMAELSVGTNMAD